MDEQPDRDKLVVTSLRHSTQNFLGYLLWAAFGLVMLWAVNSAAQLLERWIAFLRSARRSLGFPLPAAGVDYLVIGGVALVAIVAAVALAACYLAYRQTWNRKLARVWGEAPVASHTRIGSFSRSRRREYLDSLANSLSWRSANLQKTGSTRADYCELSSTMLKSIELDISARAVTAGLLVGFNRNPLLDSITIVASALELQLHVLTSLGKKPSLAVWMQLLKRAGASVFLNMYVGRDDALYLNLAIRKAAIGLEMTSDAVQETANTLADVDWDEVLGGVSVPGLSAVTSFATMSMSVGAFGLRHIGTFIEVAANDLLQGVLAGGILYFHGMQLAADCLAVDAEHRESAAMTRTISQSMMVACNPAGRMLRDQVRRMRAFLRARRQLAFTAASDAAKQGVDKLKDASVSGWQKTAGKLFR